MIANSAGTERHFSKLGHIYQDKHRSLLAPERAHKIALVNNAVRSEFPRKARAKRAFIAPTPHPEAQTPAVRASEDSENSDEEDEEAHELGAGPALIRELRSLPQDEVPEDVELPYDAAASEGEIRARRARIRVHFGTEELIPLGEIFDFGASESPWGGTLSMYETISKQGVDAQLDLLDAEALGVPEGQNAGSHDAPLVID
ncbi:hypothetical protein GGF50DRAFT_130871 [Schizophyllum commune]